ncbi:hypothetical protein N9L94_06820 [Robiginitalea sp.]|nr:hypothetical protein [Robiginitalea sp.]
MSLFFLNVRFELKILKKHLKTLEYLHFPLWIVKDASWFAALEFEEYKEVFQYISISFAVPTILITLYLVAVTESKFSRLENILLGFWLMANTSWMVSELFELPISLVAAAFFASGIMIVPFYTRLLFIRRN